MSDVIHLSDDPPAAGPRSTRHRLHRRSRRTVALVGVAAFVAISGCSGGTSSDSSGAPTSTVTTIAAEDAVDLSTPESGEILLEPIGVAMPEAFSASIAVGDEQVPAFLQPEYLLPATAAPEATTTTSVAPPTTIEGEPPTSAEAAPITTAPTAAPTAAPTTAPTAQTTAADTARVPLAQVAGNVPGLYGGTRDMAACDPEQLIGFLESNPDKAAAWADVQGIQPSEIRQFVGRLTPVVLMRDTRVTNHGFADGKAKPHQSVLQAGHAVFVDEFGVPRAKCSCGNPLAPPIPAKVTPEYVGTTWPGFDPAQIVVVIATDAVDNGFVIVDLGTGDLVTRPIGFAPGQQDADIAELLNIGNIMGIQPGTTSAGSFTVEAPTLIVAMIHYHYGPETPPGQVGLTSSDGTFYGPWQTKGSEGQGGVANAYWTAIPYEIVPAGTYTVWDSEPWTWSTNADAGGLGFSVVRGVVGVSLPPAIGDPSAPPLPPSPTELAAAYYVEIVAPLNCAYDLLDQAEIDAPGGEDGRIDPDEYDAYRQYMIPFYEVARDGARHMAEALAGYQWPPRAQPYVDQLINEVSTEAANYEIVTTLTYEQWLDFELYGEQWASAELRRELGLPPPDADDRDWCEGVGG